MKKNGRGLKIAAIAIIIVFSIAAVSIIGLYIFAKTKINYEADELLIEKSLKWEPTKFYCKSTPYYLNLGEDGYVEIQRNEEFKKAYYPKEEISDYLVDGFVAVEDHRFYEHDGVDYKRTLKAALNYIFGGEKRFGGSTITQQLIKNVSGDNQPTVTRKIGEILRAWHAERLYTKDEILEVYLNVIPMSENIYGVGMASREYFGKEPSELSCEQAAMLIGITNAPSAYNPYSNPERCLQKRNSVLRVMLEHSVITDEEYQEAVSSPLCVMDKNDEEKEYESWYIETVIDEVSHALAEKYSISEPSARLLLMRGGYSVYTNMDAEIQSKLEEYFSTDDNFPDEIKNGLNYAMVITDSESGRLLGIVGRAGKKQGNRLLNHALVPHTPASTLKPLALYAPMIDEGKITCATVFDDAPLSFVGDKELEGGYPRNSPDVYQGLITVKDALRLSKNTVAMRLCKSYGAGRVFNGLKTRFGFEYLVDGEVRDGKKYTDKALSPMALGQLTDGVTLKELTSAFSSFPRDGIYRKARAYSRVIDPDGNEVLSDENEDVRVFSKETARIMTDMLSGVVESGTAKQVTLKEYVDCAGKTGTSSGNKDKLFVGYTPYLTAGIWSGYDLQDRGVYSLSKNHLEIWDEVMLMLHSGVLTNEYEKRTFSTDGLIYGEFCKDSGEILSEACEFDPRGDRSDHGYFTPDSLPSRDCTRHVLCAYDTVSKGIAHKSCPLAYIEPVGLISVPERAFDREVEILDAEFVFRKTDEGVPWQTDPSLPYFYAVIPEDTYVGISGKKRQFNCGGRIYDE